MFTIEGGVLLAQYHQGKVKTVAARKGDNLILAITTDEPDKVYGLLGAADDLYNRKGSVNVKHKGITFALSDTSPRCAVFRGRRTKGIVFGRAGLWLACELLLKPLDQNSHAGRLEVQRGAYLAHQYSQRSLEEGLGREAAYRRIRRFIAEAVLVRDIIKQENEK